MDERAMIAKPRETWGLSDKLIREPTGQSDPKCNLSLQFPWLRSQFGVGFCEPRSSGRQVAVGACKKVMEVFGCFTRTRCSSGKLDTRHVARLID